MEIEINKAYEMDCVEFLKKLPNESIDLVVTDPPYKLTQKYGTSVDADNLMAVASLKTLLPEISRVLKKGRFAVIFYDNRILPFLFDSIKGTDLRYKRQIFLYRRWGTAHKVFNWMSTTDPVCIFTKGDDKPFRPSEKSQIKHDCYTKSSPEKVSYGHPAQKPMEIIEDIIKAFSDEGDLVCDPYLGSGTTAEASTLLNRNWVGCDNSKEFISITNNRLSEIGKTQTLIATQSTSEEPKGFNMGLEVSPTASPKLKSEILTSPNPNIRRNI